MSSLLLLGTLLVGSGLSVRSVCGLLKWLENVRGGYRCTGMSGELLSGVDGVVLQWGVEGIRMVKCGCVDGAKVIARSL